MIEETVIAAGVDRVVLRGVMKEPQIQPRSTPTP
jgi:hypothetical protein